MNSQNPWRISRCARLHLLPVLCVLLPLCARAFDAEAVKPAVPRIVLLLNNKYETGSGFVVHTESDYCIVATNCHVIEDYTDSTPLYVMRKSQGGVEAHKAEVISRDTDRDLALLKVPGMTTQALTLSTVEPAQGEDVYSIGYPAVADSKEDRMALLRLLAGGREGVLPDPEGLVTTYLEASVAKGGVRRLVMDHWKSSTMLIKIIQHDVNIGHGNSGGPLFNAAGQVVGVNTATAVSGRSSLDVDKFCMSSHISALMDILKQQNIAFLQSDTSATGGGSIATGSGGGTSPVLLSVVAIVAVAALLVAMRKREALVESYSHFAKRTGAQSAPPQEDDGDPSAITTPPENPGLRPASPPVTTCTLEGRDPDDRSAIRLVVDEALWKKSDGKIIVGRSSKHSHLCIRNKSISGEHLSLLRQDSRLLVEDRGSSNGTSLNGKKLLPYAPMQIDDGDWLQAGDVLLRFRTGKS